MGVKAVGDDTAIEIIHHYINSGGSVSWASIADARGVAPPTVSGILRLSGAYKHLKDMLEPEDVDSLRIAVKARQKGSTKSLTASKALSIVRDYIKGEGNVSRSVLAELHGVSTRTAWRILCFRDGYEYIKDALSPHELEMLAAAKKAIGSLSVSEVRWLRRLYDEEGYSIPECASIVGCHYVTALRVIKRQTYPIGPNRPGGET